jgi:hypothetical protein
MNPYESPKLIFVDPSKLVLHRRAVLALMIFTSTQALVVMVAHRLWMESPDVFSNLTSLVWQEKAVSSIAYSLVFVFLNCILFRAVQRWNQRSDDMESSPRNCLILTRILAVCFFLFAVVKPLVRWQSDTTSFFMITLSLLTLLSLYFFQREMSQSAGENSYR